MLFLTIALASHHNSNCQAAGSTPIGLMITEFYPCALSADEYFVISNAGSERLNLMNWSLTDGEGTLTFSADYWLEPGRSLVVSDNSTSYSAAFGRSPDVCFDDPSGTIVRSGTLRLADSGDSLALLSNAGVQIDFVRYGTCTETSPSWTGAAIPTLRQGEVCKRTKCGAGWCDTDSAVDWEPFREYKYGYTELPPFSATVPAGDLVAFASPDCSLDVVLDALSAAAASIRLCTYELSSGAVCEELVEAAQRGVSVRVLVDGAPAGGMLDAQEVCLSVLAGAGVDVLTLNGNLSQRIVQHTGPLHCKYAVVDSSISLILSENFVESGLPQDKVIGNRGWGVSIRSESVGRYLSSMFDSDSRRSRPDVKRWVDDERFSQTSSFIPGSVPASHSRGAMEPLRTSSDAAIQLLPSPDVSVLRPFLLTPIGQARSLIVEQFQVELDWKERWQGPRTSALIESLAESLRGGSSVRMLFDSSWYNAEGNRPACDYLAGMSANESLRGEFRMMDPMNPIQTVHNKGAVFDGRTTLVSSNNWGFSSFARNRELAALIDSEEVAEYFTGAFDMDWTADDTPPVAEAGHDQTVRLGREVELDANRSWDDRVIAHYGWDLDGDGMIDSNGPRATFVPDREGRFEMRLFVEDAWGNGDSDSVTITVTGDATSGPASLSPWSLSRLAAVLTIACGALIGRKLALRRIGGSGKINQRPGT